MELKYRKQISKEVYDALRHVEGQLDNIKLDQSTTYYMEVYNASGKQTPKKKQRPYKKKRRSTNQWLTLACRDMEKLAAKTRSAQQVRALHALFRVMDSGADGPRTYRSKEVSEYLKRTLKLKSATVGSYYVTQLISNGILVEVSDYDPESVS